MAAAARFKGVFPVVPTTFTESGELDLASQKRCVDFMIDAGSNGLCILANFSEQFVLADDEREVLTQAILEHVDGRVPVIVTTTHFSSRVCAERSRRAQDLGAAMVMVMPPYHGATIRVSEEQIYEFYRRAVGCDRHPDHDPGRTGQRHRAVAPRSSRAWRSEIAAGGLLQDRDARRRVQAARADPPGRRRDRRAVGRRRSHHAAARPRRRRHRRR